MDWAAEAGRVRRALAARARAEHQLERARSELHAAMLAALAAGVRQAALARMTGYSRERIRQITRDAGSAA